MTSCRILALNVVAEREFGDDENDGLTKVVVVDFEVHNGIDTFGGGGGGGEGVGAFIHMG